MGRKTKGKTIPYRIPYELKIALMEEQQRAVRKMSKQDILREIARQLKKRK